LMNLVDSQAYKSDNVDYINRYESIISTIAIM